MNKTIARYASFGWEALDMAALRKTYALTGGLFFHHHGITVLFRKLAVVCAGCGQQTTVPFEPRGDRPVFCKTCYQAQSGGRDSKRPRSGGGGGRGRY